LSIVFDTTGFYGSYSMILQKYAACLRREK